MKSTTNLDKEFFDETIDTEGGKKYYHITTSKPDNKAIENLLDRAFGKPQASVDHTTDGEKIQQLSDLQLKITQEIIQRENED